VRGCAGNGDAARHAEVGQQAEGAVDGLLGDARECVGDALVDLVGAHVAGVLAQGAVDDQSLRGHAHPAVAQQLLELGVVDAHDLRVA